MVEHQPSHRVGEAADLAEQLRPHSGWRLTTAYSTSVSQWPGFFRIASGTRSLPMSWSRPPIASAGRRCGQAELLADLDGAQRHPPRVPLGGDVSGETLAVRARTRGAEERSSSATSSAARGRRRAAATAPSAAGRARPGCRPRRSRTSSSRWPSHQPRSDQVSSIAGGTAAISQASPMTTPRSPGAAGQPVRALGAQEQDAVEDDRDRERPATATGSAGLRDAVQQARGGACRRCRGRRSPAGARPGARAGGSTPRGRRSEGSAESASTAPPTGSVVAPVKPTSPLYGKDDPGVASPCSASRAAITVNGGAEQDGAAVVPPGADDRQRNGGQGRRDRGRGRRRRSGSTRRTRPGRAPGSRAGWSAAGSPPRRRRARALPCVPGAARRRYRPAPSRA